MAQLHRIIVGLGTTGLSCARYLRSKNLPFEVVDSRDVPPGLTQFEAEFPEVLLTLGEFSHELLSRADELLLSPGVSLRTPAIQAAAAAGVRIVGDIAVFCEALAPEQTLVAVTGLNGKSTVVTLLAMMVRQAGLSVGLGGNLDGAEASPALDMLRQDPKDIYILELSSFQLETTPRLGASAAVILNVSDDHMDRYESKQEYQAAKQRIFLGAAKAIVNCDDEASQPWSTQGLALSHFGLNAPSKGAWGLVQDGEQSLLACGNESFLATSALKVAGKHNIANALAALALGDAIGLPREAMGKALVSFPGLPHRCQWVRRVRGVDYYNDSKGTNVGASLVAIESLGELIKGKLVLIAGGVDKGADFSMMTPVVARFAKLAVLIGRDAKNIANAMKNSIEVVFANSLQEAVAIAAQNAGDGDAVLLSPACASFDMFNDFTHRGRVFTETVEALS